MASSTSSLYVSPGARVTVMQYTPEALNGISRKQCTRINVCDRGQSTLSRSQLQDLHSAVHHKPNCSYNCLVGMALKSSKHQRLPVNEIYSYFLNKFPYFRNNAPEGWKNSIRHCLSLGPYFRKTQVAGFHGKKGFQWEPVPDKLLALEQEIARFIAEEDKVPQHYGIESLYSTGFRLLEALSPAQHKWGLQQHRAYRPQAASSSSRLGTPLHHTANEPVHSTAATAVTSSPLSHPEVAKTRSVQVNTPKPWCSENSEQTIPAIDEIGGILAYLKDGAPPETSPHVHRSVNTTCQDGQGRRDNDNNLGLQLDLDIQIDDELEERVRELVSSWGFSPSLNDSEDWLSLELVDDIDVDVRSDNLDLSSMLISDNLDTDKSLNEINFPSVLFCTQKDQESLCHSHKPADSRPGHDKHLGADDLLRPASNWNMWNEPVYVERMITLCNALFCTDGHGNSRESNRNTGGKIRASQSSPRIKFPSPNRSKVSRLTKKTKSPPSSKQIKFCGNEHTPNASRHLMKRRDEKKNIVDNRRQVYSRKLAAVRKVIGSSQMSDCSCWHKDASYSDVKRHDCKCPNTPQLIVSIPFDHLNTNNS